MVHDSSWQCCREMQAGVVCYSLTCMLSCGSASAWCTFLLPWVTQAWVNRASCPWVFFLP